MKHKINQFIYRLLSNRVTFKISSNSIIQKALEKNVEYSQYLMGVGSGGSPDTSAEISLIKILKHKYLVDLKPLCIFDIGANRGQFADLILNQLRDIPTQIHCFEPSNYTFNILYEKLSSHPQFTLNNLAFGKRVDVVDLFYDESGSGLASLSKRRLDHHDIKFNYSEKVQVDTLDNYCTENRIGRIDLLKMDVEGHELDVLTGGGNIIKSGKVKMISFEFGGCNIDTRTYFQDFFYFFKAAGNFGLYRLTPSGYLSQLFNYSEIHEQFCTTVFVAIAE